MIKIKYNQSYVNGHLQIKAPCQCKARKFGSTIFVPQEGTFSQMTSHICLIRMQRDSRFYDRSISTILITRKRKTANKNLTKRKKINNRKKACIDRKNTEYKDYIHKPASWKTTVYVQAYFLEY